MNLYINSVNPIPDSSQMNLFCKQRDVASINNDFDLYTRGVPSGISELFKWHPLFVEGTSGTFPGTTGSMNLFINRVDCNLTMPLFLKTADDVKILSTNLFMLGVIPSSGNTDLAMPETKDSRKRNLRLYTSGF